MRAAGTLAHAHRCGTRERALVPCEAADAASDRRRLRLSRVHFGEPPPRTSSGVKSLRMWKVVRICSAWRHAQGGGQGTLALAHRIGRGIAAGTECGLHNDSSELSDDKPRRRDAQTSLQARRARCGRRTRCVHARGGGLERKAATGAATPPLFPPVRQELSGVVSSCAVARARYITKRVRFVIFRSAPTSTHPPTPALDCRRIPHRGTPPPRARTLDH